MKVKALRFSTKQVKPTAQDKKVKVKLVKADYIRLIDEANKWPLSLRIAAELYRGGVSFREFADSFHLEGSIMSKHVYEYLTQMDLGRGADPDRVTPVRPVYLRYVSAVRALEERSNNGRPSDEEAIKFVRRVIEKQVERGWKEIDFIKALRAIDQETDEAPLKMQSFADASSEPKEVVKLKPVFMVRVGGEWKEAASKQAAEKLKMESASQEAMEHPTTICCWCKFPLNGTVVSKKVEQADTRSYMHLGCYFMNEVDPAQIPLGMCVMSAPECALYEWTEVNNAQGKPTRGWVKKTTSPQNNTGNAESGVPAPSGDESKPPVALPAPKEEARPVLDVRPEGSVPSAPVPGALPEKGGKRKGKSKKPAAKGKALPKRKKLPA